jgi:tetratricopeptide (TPR) repeat protein
MKRARFYPLVACLMALVLLFTATSPASACGPFMVEAIFVHTVHPDYPMDRFAAGRIGVVQPSYARSYLYVAYRYLSGSSFTPDEQKALTSLWKDRLEFGWSAGDEDWVKTWVEARRRVVAQDPAPISVYRDREKPNEYESYLNCQKDAFDTAIATLNERIAKYGADSANVKTWLEAQDQVFSNCSGGSSIPAELPSDADALMRADRAYQIAAANFYATNFDAARKGFDSIAADSTSPWRNNATYLVARTLARKGSLGPPEQKQESLSGAEAQLRKILADKNLSSLHAASARLLNLVRLRAHPEERLKELAQTLTTKTNNPNLKQDLWDYTILLDGYLEKDEEETTTTPAIPKEEDLTDWIATLQDSSEAARDHALARWQANRSNATRSYPWLIAVLSLVDGQHPKANELIAEALKVTPRSAAFASARYHAIRLLIETGKNTEARTLLDQTLKTDRAHFNESALNLLTGQRMLLANSLDEFLADAARVPAALSWNDDGRELPLEPGEASDETKAQVGKPFFDVDAAKVINQQLPLSLLKEAARSKALPPGPRLDLLQAAWLRAALLGDTKTADELTPLLAASVPEIAALVNGYLSSAQPDEKKFAAIYAWLKTPGLEPVVDAGFGRQIPLSQQDSYRDNWWCSASFVPATPEENREAVQFTAVTTGAPPRFLSPADLANAKKEWNALSALGTAPNYIVQSVIQWANSHPNDPRVPEALHLAVRTTRYGCTDKDSARWSKAAFDLLHRKYPNNPWTKKTPYWFKD